MTKYIVVTGIVAFTIFADTPEQAIEQLMQRISARRHEHYNKEIGMSLVEALDAGRLRFAVMDENRERLLAGYYQNGPDLPGCFEKPVTRWLAESLSTVIPEGLIFTTPYALPR